MEIICDSIKGFYRDVIINDNKQTIFDSGWKKNTIVDSLRISLARFLKNDPPGGIRTMKVGQGEERWDSGDAPAPGSEVQNLINPSPFEIADLDIDYLDDNDTIQEGPSNRIQITATFGQDEPPPIEPLTTYPLREFGLFGGGNGDPEYMINCIRHPVIHKENNVTLVRTVRLYF